MMKGVEENGGSALNKEYWLDPKHNRRKSSGRREADYSVCPYHEDHEKQNETDKAHFCGTVKALQAKHDADIIRIHERMEKMDGRIVGWRALGLMVTIFLAMFALFGTINVTMFNTIKSDLKAVESTISALSAVIK